LPGSGGCGAAATLTTKVVFAAAAAEVAGSAATTAAAGLGGVTLTDQVESQTVAAKVDSASDEEIFAFIDSEF
jgi:hypothetical protein